MNRALKSLNYWRAEMAELRYVVAHRGDSRRYKRNAARARRRLDREITREACS